MDAAAELDSSNSSSFDDEHSGMVPLGIPFRIQDPYTGKFVFNRNDDLRLRANGRGMGGEDGGDLWELADAASRDNTFESSLGVETGYLLKNVRTGQVIVDESAGDGIPSSGFRLSDVNAVHSNNQLWIIEAVECDSSRRKGRLYRIRNSHNRAFLLNGLRAKGKRRLRTKVLKRDSRNIFWKIVFVDSTVQEQEVISKEKRTRRNSRTQHQDSLELPVLLVDNVDMETRSPTESRVSQHEGSWISDPLWKRWIQEFTDCEISKEIAKIADNSGSNDGLHNIREILVDNWQAMPARFRM
ncbi:hypothetical protein MPTK1_8g06920 [Marchantia polymorpha subsp. ruderalis]|uniref:Uncharacterized protein n=1 Tax=Marchantia polymorpha TaxID=3197 RepID=A0A2R6XID7_MARPO|nr:hypothetical protein MARPO_0013s0100 [Marchantia polymorpha]PTQ45875.1 hypothetical protein MARPO_0013s0100 [Marchantia polymorpha]BBN18971.1 hypothetical protein Mp_8g06920 [Marchantia polymorpha subsp. ruderalis]BBN18972.1 hypothetical protein Mp_8g06920 [Marchantia polymorpha subsp. ruderalis]|eukprot:PTQ45874.1 hypothetical protein MARPO_0013s0100 [Marchantia polymorpha]